MMISTRYAARRVALSLFSALALTAFAQAQTLTFGVYKDGAQAGGTNAGTSFSTVTLDTVTGSFSIAGTYSGMALTVNKVRLYGPAAIGATTSNIFNLIDTGGTSGTISGGGTLLASEVSDLIAGLHYISVEENGLGAGSIRGQIIQQTNIDCAAELVTDPVLLDTGGNPIVGPLIGNAAQPFGVSLDCTGVGAPGIALVFLTPAKRATAASTKFGDIWVVGQTVYRAFVAHTVSVELFGPFTLPIDIAVIGQPFTVQGFCGDTTPGVSGRTSNAIRGWIGL